MLLEMRITATSAGGARVALAVGFWLSVFLAEAHAQFFNIGPLPRPPSEVPGQTPGPAQNIAPPNNNRPAAVPKGQMLQSLPPTPAPPPAGPAQNITPPNTNRPAAVQKGEFLQPPPPPPPPPPAATAPPAIAPAGH